MMHGQKNIKLAYFCSSAERGWW